MFETSIPSIIALSTLDQLERERIYRIRDRLRTGVYSTYQRGMTTTEEEIGKLSFWHYYMVRLRSLQHCNFATKTIKKAQRNRKRFATRIIYH